jgi:DNA polymerase-3 subunit beta
MISVQSTQFRKAALFAASVVERRNTIPVLSTLKVTANGSLTLVGTDLDSYASASLPYDGDESEFLLPEPAKIAKALKAAGGEVVTLSQGDKTLHIEAGELSSNLSSNMAPDDFPAVVAVAHEVFGANVGADFFRALDRVRPAISVDPARYYLTGIYFDKVSDWLYRAVATDGHRLFIAEVPMPGASGELAGGIIIPRRAVAHVIAAFSKTESGVRFVVGGVQNTNRKDPSLAPVVANSRVEFAGNVGDLDLSLTTKLIDGNYPDVSRVIPTEHPFTIRVNRVAMATALKSITPLSRDKTRAIKLAATAGQITLTLRSPDVGTSQFPVAAEHGAPDGFEFGMNARYLAEAIGALAGDEVDIGISDPDSPMTITDPSDLTFKVVQMPMRI